MNPCPPLVGEVRAPAALRTRRNELDPDMIQAHLILLERRILSFSDILAGCSWTSLSIALHRFREIVAGPYQLFKVQFAGRRLESDNMQNATIH